MLREQHYNSRSKCFNAAGTAQAGMDAASLAGVLQAGQGQAGLNAASTLAAQQAAAGQAGLTSAAQTALAGRDIAGTATLQHQMLLPPLEMLPHKVQGH